MTDPTVGTPGQPTAQTAGLASGGAGSRRFRGAGNYLALVPFHAYIGVFLILPTLIVTIGAVTTASGAPTLDNISVLFTDVAIGDAFVRSIQLSIATAIVGAVLGGLLGWAVARGIRTGSCASS